MKKKRSQTTIRKMKRRTITIGMKTMVGMRTGQVHPVGPGTQKQKHGTGHPPEISKIWTMKNVSNSPGKVKLQKSILTTGQGQAESSCTPLM